mgnify:FL=1
MRTGAGALDAASSETRAVYEIQIEGEQDQSWEQWLDGLTIRSESPGLRPVHAAAESAGQRPLHTAKPARPHSEREDPSRTTLAGAVADQAALRGLLCRLWDLNLTVVSVQRIERGEQGG